MRTGECLFKESPGSVRQPGRMRTVAPHIQAAGVVEAHEPGVGPSQNLGGWRSQADAPFPEKWAEYVVGPSYCVRKAVLTTSPKLCPEVVCLPSR